MPETIEPFDLDAWLDGAKRTERSVTVYGRADLLADIDDLELERGTVAAIPEADRAMGDSSGSHLQSQIDALIIQMDKSKMVLRVRSLIDDETEAIRTETQKDIKDILDAAASDARADAVLQCKRAGVTATNDINSLVRTAAITASTTVLQRESDVRILASAIVSPPMSVAQVKKLVERIGEKQVNLIKAAYSRATNEAPKVALPKSLTPSQSDETSMS